MKKNIYCRENKSLSSWNEFESRTMETPNSRPIGGKKDLGNTMKKALISIITIPRRKRKFNIELQSQVLV